MGDEAASESELEQICMGDIFCDSNSWFPGGVTTHGDVTLSLLPSKENNASLLLGNEQDITESTHSGVVGI